MRALSTHGKRVGAWAGQRFEVEEIIDAGDRVPMIVHESGRGEESGVEIDQRTFWVQTMRDAKIVHSQLFVDRTRALEAAGLREQHETPADQERH